MLQTDTHMLECTHGNILHECKQRVGKTCKQANMLIFPRVLVPGIGRQTVGERMIKVQPHDRFDTKPHKGLSEENIYFKFLLLDLNVAL